MRRLDQHSGHGTPHPRPCFPPYQSVCLQRRGRRGERKGVTSRMQMLGSRPAAKRPSIAPEQACLAARTVAAEAGTKVEGPGKCLRQGTTACTRASVSYCCAAGGGACRVGSSAGAAGRGSSAGRRQGSSPAAQQQHGGRAALQPAPGAWQRGRAAAAARTAMSRPRPAEARYSTTGIICRRRQQARGLQSEQPWGQPPGAACAGQPRAGRPPACACVCPHRWGCPHSTVCPHGTVHPPTVMV